MKIENPLRLIILWFILIITMILHSKYHLSGIFYGEDLLIEGSDGTTPTGTHIIRNVFYHLPVIWILLLIYFRTKAVRIILLIIAALYTVSHGMHLSGELIPFNGSQTPLLTLTFIVSAILTYEHFRYWKSEI